jgi:squalene synthase HpnC
MTVSSRLATPTRPAEVPALEISAVMEKARHENFPVALAVLPRALRQQLLAIYGYARFVDDLGDLYDGDRLAALEWAESELDAALLGQATNPVFDDAAKMARASGAGRELFVDLIAANRLDQSKTRYANFEELLGYCALSANPVGRLVLFAFGRSDETAGALSDQVCSGLQVIEHLQDVGEDYRAGRIYLPAEDLERFGVGEAELAAPSASPALRRMIAFECGRAGGLLDAGIPLVRLLAGTPRLALAGFVGGGLAQLEAIAAQDYDVLRAAAKASKRAVLGSAATVLRRAARRS